MIKGHMLINLVFLILAQCYCAYAISPPFSVIIIMTTQKSRSDYDKVKMQASPSLHATEHQKEGFGCEAPRQSNILSRGCI